jgi:hypothetical protein
MLANIMRMVNIADDDRCCAASRIGGPHFRFVADSVKIVVRNQVETIKYSIDGYAGIDRMCPPGLKLGRRLELAWAGGPCGIAD